MGWPGLELRPRHDDGEARLIQLAGAAIPVSEPVIFGLDAMRTRFELVLHGAEPALLSAAGAEAMEEIRAAEAQLSIFRSDSWLTRLNLDAAAGDAVAVPAPLHQLLRQCAAVHQASDGAFDPTTGPSLDAHGLRDQSPVWSEQAGAEADFASIHLESPARVRFARPGLQLDLGGIGKGWALDRAAEVLRDAGVPAALLHGGTSTVLSFGAPFALAGRAATPRGWQIGVEPFASVALRDAALSVSASRPQSRRPRGHVIDPRTQQPLRSGSTAAVVASSATLADAWSTALLVQSRTPFSWKSLL